MLGGPGGCRTALLAVSVFSFAVAAVFFVIGALGASVVYRGQINYGGA